MTSPDGLNGGPPVARRCERASEMARDEMQSDSLTVEETPETGDVFVELGRQLRTARRRRSLTLEAAAEAAGITAGYLSQIERGQASPTLMALKRITDSLSVRLADLFQEEGLASPYGLVRHDQRPAFRHPLTGRLHHYLTPTWGGHMSGALYTLRPGEATERLFHAGEEFVFVLHGEIEYRIGRQVYRLATGDSLYFDAAEPHSVVNVGVAAAEWIWVATVAP